MPDLRLSISYTTRPQRGSEVHGTNYHFVSEDEFKLMCERGEFLEYAEVFGHYYGTSRQWVQATLTQRNNIVLEIDWRGAKQIRENVSDSLGIFILPPSIEKLTQRLVDRKQDSAKVIRQRLTQARDEMNQCTNADYLVINNDFQETLAHLQGIFRASAQSDSLRASAQQRKHAQLIASLTHPLK